ncbi:MAG TPA: undecaprenyl-diphosphate phosphatase [Trebonia sp.]
MSHHLTYLEAVVTGLVQGVTELFPVSSLGHNVLIPALVGGSWASTLNVQAKNSPYLAFVVGLHVATAIAMIAYFWRDWLRIVRGFFSSLRNRSVKTPDERLAWMIILATIPVGIVGAALQKVFVSTFAKPELAALFLAVNGVILLVSERMRRSRDVTGAAVGVPAPTGAAPAGWQPPPPPGWPAAGPRPGGPGPEGYSQQPQQQQWQGPDPRYGQHPGDGQPPAGRHGHAGTPARRPEHGGYAGSHAARNTPDGRPAGERGPEDTGSAVEEAIAADQRLSTMGFMRAVLIGSAQVVALLPGISRDGIVTVAGMGRGLRRSDAVRFSFLLSAPVILAAGALKAKDLTGPLSTGIHGPILVGSLIAGVGAYLSIRFLTKYFSEDKSLSPFGIYCLVAGLAALAYLALK